VESKKINWHWHFYSEDGIYATYDITDSAYVWINYSELNKNEDFERLAVLSKEDTLGIIMGGCGDIQFLMRFQNDTLLLFEENYHELRYWATKHDRTKCNSFLDYYGSLPVFIDLSTVQNATDVPSKKSLTSHLYIGKSKRHLQRKYPKNQHLVIINDKPMIKKEEIVGFISTELDKLDDSEHPHLEVYLNADKETPPALIDSIKTIVHAAYPDLKLYRTVRQANTGKVGKVKL
jgi:hypothetical protein